MAQRVNRGGMARWREALAPVLVLVILAILIQAKAPSFGTAGNLRNVLTRLVPLALIAIGQTLVIISGQIDLSVGSVMALSAVTAVDRAELPRRLANLALIATIVDVAIREGVRSIDAVQILQPEVRFAAQGPDAFISEWPVMVTVTGTPDAVRAILNVLTDPARPTPLGSCSLKQANKRDGLLRAEIRAYSIRVRGEVPLGLENEGE
ncbi:MAG: ABC transporter permease [Armatimonadetes bacterium]|nr:ABC transporter permease [Armatimonadota bacterium]